MSELFAQLAKQGCIPKNPDTELLSPRVTAPAAATTAEKELMESLGLLFVQAAKSNLPIGQIFDLVFLRIFRFFLVRILGNIKKILKHG